MSNKTLVKDLAEGALIRSQFAVKFKKPPREYAKGYRFDIRASDRTGELTSTYWGGTNLDEINKLYESFTTGDVVELSGIVGKYQDQLQISINPEHHILRRCARSEYSIEDFLPRTPNDIGQMTAKLEELISSIKNPHLKQLLDSFFTDEKFRKQFLEAPASMELHSNYVGGLLEHTLMSALVVDSLCAIYPKLDRDLALTGAILHDIGKIREFEATTSIDVSEEGMLRGHVIIGDELVEEKINSIPDFPKTLALKVSHIMLSHHKELEWGAPKRPQFAEALAVHYADDIDAKLYQFITLKENAETEDPWIWNKRIGHVYLK